MLQQLQPSLLSSPNTTGPSLPVLTLTRLNFSEMFVCLSISFPFVCVFATCVFATIPRMSKDGLAQSVAERNMFEAVIAALCKRLTPLKNK